MSSTEPVIESAWDAPESAYDRGAATYDAMVSSRLYNRLAWGTDPADYVAFAREAVGSGTRIVLVDHEDSFVHTLANYFRQTGAEVKIPARTVPKFSAGKGLKDAVN